MGRVYRAERLDGSGGVAVKVLNEDCSDNQDLRERFEREARALFALAHPHILDVQDYGVLDGRQPFLVMELLTGRTLEDLVESSTLHPELALELGRQFLSGLAFAHSQGVLHRDLKTENIFVVTLPGGRLHAKLLDFGLVKFVDDDRWGEGRKLTMAGSVMGSPAYMSPEQGTGGPMDARSDVYSAGVVLYELLTGTWPFMGESRMEMLKAHLLEPVPALASGRPELVARPELDALLHRAMAKDAAGRFVDAREMLAALEAIPRPAAWLEPIHPSAAAQVAAAAPFAAAPGAPASIATALATPPGAPLAAPAPAPLTAALAPPPAPSMAGPASGAAPNPPMPTPRKLPLVPLLAAGGVLALCLLTAFAAALAKLVL